MREGEQQGRGWAAAQVAGRIDKRSRLVRAAARSEAAGEICRAVPCSCHVQQAHPQVVQLRAHMAGASCVANGAKQSFTSNLGGAQPQVVSHDTSGRCPMIQVVVQQGDMCARAGGKGNSRL
jgi:hypothetical protein